MSLNIDIILANIVEEYRTYTGDDYKTITYMVNNMINDRQWDDRFLEIKNIEEFFERAVDANNIEAMKVLWSVKKDSIQGIPKLKYFIRKGKLQSIIDFVKESDDEGYCWMEVVIASCKYNKIKIIKYIFDHCNNYRLLCLGINISASRGCSNLVSFLIKKVQSDYKKPFNYTRAFTNATLSGHSRTIKILFNNVRKEDRVSLLETISSLENACEENIVRILHKLKKNVEMNK